MSQQGPILLVSAAEQPSISAALVDARIFPVIETSWANACRAIEQIQPAAVLAAMSGSIESDLEPIAIRVATRKPYLPLIAVNPRDPVPENAIPFTETGSNLDRLAARLRAALRVRTLHATVIRRLRDEPTIASAPLDPNPARDATVLLIGRGASYPALSVSLGQRMEVVGAFSIEAAAKHLNTRDIDGIVLGEGFTARVVDAFLNVLSEDARFRNLPVLVTSEQLAHAYDLPNLEMISGGPARITANALPLIRQHAFEAYLSRTLQSIEAGGLLDPRTGLLTRQAFDRDLATTVYQTLSNGGGLSVARFAFDFGYPRAQLDGARIVSRLMRKMDFAAIQQDGSIIVVLTDTDLRTAHMIARRLWSVMCHTSGGERQKRPDPVVTVATLLPSDSARSLVGRLYGATRRDAS